jgi:hypothetical protein
VADTAAVPNRGLNFGRPVVAREYIGQRPAVVDPETGTGRATMVATTLVRTLPVLTAHTGSAATGGTSRIGSQAVATRIWLSAKSNNDAKLHGESGALPLSALDPPDRYHRREFGLSTRSAQKVYAVPLSYRCSNTITDPAGGSSWATSSCIKGSF